MSQDNIRNILGLGVYTLQEASLYSGVSVNKLSRWIFGASNCKPVIESEISYQYAISFLDMIQAMAINKARDEDISLRKIREAIRYAKKQYDITLPLAYNHRLLLFGRDLYIELPNKAIVQASGGGQGQGTFREIVEPFMRDIKFNAQGLAKMLIPFSKYNKHIVLDPTRQFGQPIVEKTGYRADILEKAFNAEGSYKLAAKAFGIGIQDIKIAVEYMQSRRTAA